MGVCNDGAPAIRWMKAPYGDDVYPMPHLDDGRGETWQIYSARAEFQFDMLRFFNMVPAVVTCARSPIVCRGDVDFEFKSPADLSTLMAMTHLADDLHVIRQTLRPCPLAANTLARDWAID